VPGSSWWAKGDLNPHPLAGTWPSTMRVCLFRHSPMPQMQAPASLPPDYTLNVRTHFLSVLLQWDPAV
jgi:hypothetical protein